MLIYILPRQVLISHTYLSLNWPSFQRGRCCILNICIYARGIDLSNGFVLQLTLEGADSLPQGTYLTRIKLKTHVCSRGPDSLLKKSWPLRSWFPPRGLHTFKELFLSSKVSNFEAPFLSQRYLSRSLRGVLSLEVLLPSSRRILGSCFHSQDVLIPEDLITPRDPPFLMYWFSLEKLPLEILFPSRGVSRLGSNFWSAFSLH